MAKDKRNNLYSHLNTIKIKSQIKKAFQNDLSIKVEAYNEILNQETKFYALTKLSNEFVDLLNDWCDLVNIHFVDTDSGKIYNHHKEFVESTDFFNLKEEKVKDIYNQYFKLIEYISPISKEISKLETKIAFKKQFEKTNVIQSQIESKTEKQENIITETKVNPHPRIFKSGTHFKLFEYLKESVNNEHADFSFIFRAMHKDEFIYPDIKEKAFRDWLTKTYGIDTGKLKLYDYCKTQSKVSNYGTSKLHYKL